MTKVFISRSDGNVPWGFRLQGGFDYNEPLRVINIVPNSPADGKIDPGDILLDIAGNNVTQMTHHDALELIQRCANALFLTVHKVGYAYPPGGGLPRPAPMAVWRPPVQQQQQPPYYPHDFQQQPFGYGLSAAPPPMYNPAPPPPPPMMMSMPAANVPPAPIFNADLIANAAATLKNRGSVFETQSSFEQTVIQDISNVPAALAKSLGRPGGPKPFTYTPGGLDLSKIRESARVRRHREYVSNSEEPNDDIQQESETMNRRMVLPPDSMNNHHYNASSPIQPFSYARSQPPPPKKHVQHDTDVVTQSRSFQMLQGWIADSEKTVPTACAPPSQQATSSSTSTTTTTTTAKSAVARAVLDEQSSNRGRRRSSGSSAALPSRSFRYLQEQYDASNGGNDNGAITTTSTTVEEITSGMEGAGLRRGSDAHMPSRAFKYLQDHCDASNQQPINRTQTVNNRDDLAEIYNKPPPSFREREPEAPRYTGATVPSRSFRFLQMMTQDDQNAPTSTAGYTKPQQKMMNKYDEQNATASTNKFDAHPSRAFKFLQEMTGDQPTVTSSVTRTERRISGTDGGQQLKMRVEVRESQPMVKVSTTSSQGNVSNPFITNVPDADIGATDF